MTLMANFLHGNTKFPQETKMNNLFRKNVTGA